MVAAACSLLHHKLCIRPCKIYELAEVLVEHNIYPWADDDLVRLYQKLFITQAALCELYFQLEEEGDSYLLLTPVEASIRARSTNAFENNAAAERELVQDSLRPNIEFFSDPANFYSVTADDVKRLLEGFWTRYQAHFSRDESLEILDLNSQELKGVTSSLQVQNIIRAAYRKAASAHHPDRGGNPEKFRAVRQAYEQLKLSF